MQCIVMILFHRMRRDIFVQWEEIFFAVYRLAEMCSTIYVNRNIKVASQVGESVTNIL